VSIDAVLLAHRERIPVGVVSAGFTFWSLKMRFITKVSPLSMLMAMVYAIAMVVVFMYAPGAYAQSGNVYGQDQVQTTGTVVEGMVLQVEIKAAAASAGSRTAGASIGALIGGLAGNRASGGNSNAIAILGATIGGFAGRANC